MMLLVWESSNEALREGKAANVGRIAVSAGCRDSCIADCLGEYSVRSSR